MITRIILDTTYLLPAFGVEVSVDSSDVILEVLERFLSMGGVIYVSTISVLEAYLKAYRLSEKKGNDKGIRAAEVGFMAIVNDNRILKVDFMEMEVFREAHRIRRTHGDPFDCFIFATAKALGTPLVTEDREAKRYLTEVVNWGEFKRRVLSASGGGT